MITIRPEPRENPMSEPMEPMMIYFSCAAGSIDVKVFRAEGGAGFVGKAQIRLPDGRSETVSAPGLDPELAAHNTIGRVLHSRDGAGRPVYT